MNEEEVQELQKPLTEIEKAQLTAACQHHLNPKGMMLLRSLIFSVDSATKATAARCVEICLNQVSRHESRIVTVGDCAEAIKKEFDL